MQNPLMLEFYLNHNAVLSWFQNLQVERDGHRNLNKKTGPFLGGWGKKTKKLDLYKHQFLIFLNPKKKLRDPN